MSQQKNNPKKTRLYHFTELEHAISNIQKKWLKIARWDDLNDPFELRNVMPSQVKEEDFEKWRDVFANEFGLLCFSKKYTNPVMWGHYAANASGVALGFDVLASDQLEVNYCNCFLAPMTKQNAKQFPQDLVSTKAKDWRYEDEVRTLQKLSEVKCEYKPAAGKFLYFEPFSRAMKLREILLGVDCKADQSTINAMKRHVSSGVKIYKTERSQDKYEIVKKAENL